MYGNMRLGLMGTPMGTSYSGSPMDPVVASAGSYGVHMPAQSMGNDYLHSYESMRHMPGPGSPGGATHQSANQTGFGSGWGD